jgi:SAM-dependent methyltransferase
MRPRGISAPGPMPVDRAAWAKQLSLSNFVNSYYQYRDLQRCGEATSVLIIGPGQGLDAAVLKWRGYRVTTFDIDETFAPDVHGSVHEMAMFADGQFDAVIASHVLEHLAESYLDPSLNEIARVGRHALIYLPVAGRHCQARLTPGFKGIDLSLIVDVFNYFRRPDGVTPRYAQGQHFWEVGFRGFRVRDIRRRMCRFFDILTEYRNRDWIPSQNFVLRSRRWERNTA